VNRGLPRDFRQVDAARQTRQAEAGDQDAADANHDNLYPNKQYVENGLLAAACLAGRASNDGANIFAALIGTIRKFSLAKQNAADWAK
jgi:hypothetical protein